MERQYLWLMLGLHGSAGDEFDQVPEMAFKKRSYSCVPLTISTRRVANRVGNLNGYKALVFDQWGIHSYKVLVPVGAGPLWRLDATDLTLWKQPFYFLVSIDNWGY